jgi:hypothetical protein
MAFSDYSSTPALNVTIGGVSIAEDCAPGNLNDAVRYIMADAKAFAGSIPDFSTLMPKSGGAFTGNITRSGSGAYRYNADSSLTGGATYFQATGSARPTAAEGVVVFYY